MGRKRKRDTSRGKSGGIVSRRTVIGILAVGGIGAVGLQGTGAFDAINSQREFGVSTANDENALLGVTSEGVSGFDLDTVTLLQLTNQLGEPLDSISAQIVSSSTLVDSIDAPEALDVSETGEVQATLTCENSGTVDVKITASSRNEEIELIQPVDVECKTLPVCAARELPSGGTINSIPKGKNKQTDSSVVIDKSGQIKETISGVSIGGAAEFRTGSQVTLTFDGNTTIDEYVKVDAPSQIDFALRGNAVIKNGVKILSESQLDFEIENFINNGVCIDKAGEVKFSARDATVDGEVSMSSTDQIKINELVRSTVGPLTIDASGQAELVKILDSTVGPIDMTASGQVKFPKLEHSTVGPISIDASGQIDIIGGAGSVIDGEIDIPDAGGQVAITLKDGSQVRGGISITNESQIKLDLSGGSTVGSAVDIDTDSQVKTIIDGSTLKGDLEIDTVSQVKIAMTDGEIQGNVTVTSDSQVNVTLAGDSTITGDLTIDTPSGVTVTGCSGVEGAVTPTTACD